MLQSNSMIFILRESISTIDHLLLLYLSDSCSDDPGHDQHDGRHHHHHNTRQGNNLNSSSRRHKSSSPNRKSMRSRSQGGVDCNCGGDHCRNSASRSKSAGHMTANGNNDCHCHCFNESTRR